MQLDLRIPIQRTAPTKIHRHLSPFSSGSTELQRRAVPNRDAHGQHKLSIRWVRLRRQHNQRGHVHEPEQNNRLVREPGVSFHACLSALLLLDLHQLLEVFKRRKL